MTAEGRNGEEIAAELGVSAATLYNWRRAYGGMDRWPRRFRHAVAIPRGVDRRKNESR
ncbi:transposase [Mycolicibacterium mengxianglii]|uniref:transposase n=1 Tax=Mycolicibacterium mengxianglii TaxID=2736649 RepID=UPI0018D1C71D|nr:transposase [Mycolicibacterium mengxianglii]